MKCYFCQEETLHYGTGLHYCQECPKKYNLSAVITWPGDPGSQAEAGYAAIQLNMSHERRFGFTFYLDKDYISINRIAHHPGDISGHVGIIKGAKSITPANAFSKLRLYLVWS